MYPKIVELALLAYKHCKPGIITVVMPSSKSIEVWAKDLDDGSFDNCSRVRLSLSSDLTDTMRVVFDTVLQLFVTSHWLFH